MAYFSSEHIGVIRIPRHFLHAYRTRLASQPFEEGCHAFPFGRQAFPTVLSLRNPREIMKSLVNSHAFAELGRDVVSEPPAESMAPLLCR